MNAHTKFPLDVEPAAPSGKPDVTAAFGPTPADLEIVVRDQGPGVPAEFAARLRAQADDDDYATEGTFAIAEQVPTEFAARERLEKQRLRGVL